MTLKEKIKEDMKAAFKASDAVTRGTLSLLLSVIQNRELEKRAKGAEPVLTDEEVVGAVSSEIKKRKESVAAYEQAGRGQAAASEQQELTVLMRYMPEQMSEDEVKRIVADAVAATGASGAKDIGKVMGSVMAATRGRFDGTRISVLVKKALGA